MVVTGNALVEGLDIDEVERVVEGSGAGADAPKA